MSELVRTAVAAGIRGAVEVEEAGSGAAWLSVWSAGAPGVELVRVLIEPEDVTKLLGALSAVRVR